VPGDDGSQEKARLGWKDYLALFVAFLTTIFLPLLVLIVILVAILLFSAVLR
jgi:hypothetical protein